MTKSSSLTQFDLEKIAILARLKLSSEEIVTYLDQLKNIFSYLEIIKAVDTTNIQPFANHLTNSTEFLRPDEVSPGLSKSEFLEQASTDGDFVIAPQTIHKE